MEGSERARPRFVSRDGDLDPRGDRAQKRRPGSFPVGEISKFEKMSRQDVVMALIHIATLLQTFLEGMRRTKGSPPEALVEMELALENTRMIQKWIRDTSSPDQVHRVITPQQIHDKAFTTLDEAQGYTREPYRKGQ